MTQRALRVLRRCDTVIGYKGYLDLLGGLVDGKKLVPGGMGQELERARWAIDEALAGKEVALVSGGDPGVYGMAGPVLEVLREQGMTLDLEIVPGVSAFNACAARLGAPLMNDFAVISLSDLLTPWPVIFRRLELAAQADLVIVLYNPSSSKRLPRLQEAHQLLLRYRPPHTWVGIVRDAFRQAETVVITRLENLMEQTIDMHSTVIVGNSTTVTHQGYLVTPRGYCSPQGQRD